VYGSVFAEPAVAGAVVEAAGAGLVVDPELDGADDDACGVLEPPALDPLGEDGEELEWWLEVVVLSGSTYCWSPAEVVVPCPSAVAEMSKASPSTAQQARIRDARPTGRIEAVLSADAWRAACAGPVVELKW